MARASDAHGIGFRSAMTDPFALPAAEATPLAARIAGRIRRAGPIRFAAFMEAALYDPELGYYRSGRPTVGREGDFLTSPEVHPIFGYALGRLAAALWEALERPACFTVRDVGPGSGALLESLFAWADSGRGGAGFAAALRGELVEPAAAAAERQRRRLGPWRARLRWQERPEASEPVRGLVIGNELLDAQPVQRLRWSGSAWEELYVDVAAGRFVEVRRAIQEAALLRPLAGVAAREGQVVEVCPSLAALTGRLAATVGTRTAAALRLRGAAGAALRALASRGDAADLPSPQRRRGPLRAGRRAGPQLPCGCRDGAGGGAGRRAARLSPALAGGVLGESGGDESGGGRG